MKKRLLILFVAFIFLFASFLSAFLSSGSMVKAVSENESEIINTKDLLGTISYSETAEEFTIRLSLIKKASIQPRELSINLNTTGEDLEALQLSKIPSEFKEGEAGAWTEKVAANEEKEYVFNGSISKKSSQVDGLLTVGLELSEKNSETQPILIVDSEKEGQFTLPLVTTKGAAKKSNKNNIEQNIISNSKLEPFAALEANTTSANSGPSLLAEIMPFFSNAGSVDPFAYSNDALGIYPTHNAGAAQGANVRNYNYGAADPSTTIPLPPVAKPETMTGTSLNFTSGYHQYSGAYTKKWAEPVKDGSGNITDPTLFNVYLEVIGDTTKTANPIDIVLLLDKSGSMLESIGADTKDTQLRAAVQSFSNTLLSGDPNLDVRIGLVNFGSASDGLPMFSNSQNLTSSAATINTSPVLLQTPVGATPTVLGLKNAMSVLYGTGARATASKILVIIGDGAPTVFYQPVEVRSKLATNSNWGSWGDYLATNGGATPGTGAGPLFNYDGSELLNNEKYPNKFGSTAGLPAKSPDNTIDYQYRWTNYTFIGTGYSDLTNARKGMIYTLGYANWLASQDPRYASISTYSIGVGIGSTSQISVIGRNTLKNLSKNQANYYSADSQGDLLTILSNLATKISKTLQSAKLVDPIGTAVTLVGDPQVNSFSVNTTGTTSWTGSAATDPKQFVTLTKAADNSSLEWNKITLGKDEGLRFSYQVRLKDDNQNGLLYPLNGETYLVNGPSFNLNEKLHFAIPSARYVALTSVKVKKIWSDNANDWQLRTPVVLQLQRSVNGGAFQNVAGKTFTVTPTATGPQLENTFTNLEKFDSAGNLYTYQVVETTAINAYSSPTYSDQHLTVTNSLITTNLTFKKLDHDGVTPLPNITFELTATNGRKIQATSNASGTVTFTGVPIGTYSIAEVTALSSYQTMPTFTAVVSKVSDTVLSTTFDMSGIPTEMYTLSGQNLTVINKYAKGKFSFKKVGNDGTTPLSQVTFELLQGSSVIQSATSAADGTVLFNDVYPGNYTLKEVSTVNGYSLINDISIVVTTNKNASGEQIVQGLPANNILQNNLKNFSLSLNKVAVDNLQNGIPGAEFSLYYLGTFLEKQLSDANGKVDFTQNLIPGRNYTVVETAVPAGYLPITGVFTVQVKTSGQIIIDYAGEVLTSDQVSVALTSGTGNNTIQYTVKNDSKRPLPRTGGRGIYISITAGVLAMLTASFFYLKGRKGGAR